MFWLLIAQLVTNPNFLQFDSVDHYTQAVLTYHVDFTQTGASQPFTGFDVAAGAVLVVNASIPTLEVNLNTQAGSSLIGLPFGTQYTASIVAISSAGASVRSAPSNPFERAPLTPRVVLNPIVGRRP